MWRRSATLLLLLLMAGTAGAWSIPGHEHVAALAEERLRPQTRAATLALLAAEGHQRLADVAGWADRVRDEPAYAWSIPLHYVNHPRGGCDYRPERDCPQGRCVVAAVQRFRDELADRRLPEYQRREALKFLLHFIADIHQPLHAGHAHDKGGNTFQINLDGKGSNLHRIWDFSLLDHGGRSKAEQRAALQATALPAAGRFDPVAWAGESCRIVMQDGFYPSRRRLTASYLDTWRPLAELRLRLAAARLAAVLEEALGQR